MLFTNRVTRIIGLLGSVVLGIASTVGSGGGQAPADIPLVESQRLFIQSFTFSPAAVDAGQVATGTVMLNASLSADSDIALTSDNPAVVIVPASVHIAAGSASGSFTANTGSVTTPTVVQVSAAFGVGARASLTVNPAPATAPSITSQPANVTVSAGQAATFTVVAAGTAPIGYQWRRNGVDIAGATSASYTTPATTAADSGAQFDVVVSNALGTVTSNSVTLTVAGSATVGFVQLVSAGLTGANGQGSSEFPAINGDGGAVAFFSAAKNDLVATPTMSRNNTFLRSTCVNGGCSNASTQAVSVTSTGGIEGDNDSQGQQYAAISRDGLVVAFQSFASNLDPNNTNAFAAQTYVRTLCAGGSPNCTPTTVMVSLDEQGQPLFGSANPSVGASGRYVAFDAVARIPVTPPANPMQNEVFVRDTCRGANAGCVPATRIVSLAPDGTTPANGPTDMPSVSSDGRFVAYRSRATNLLPFANPSGANSEIFVRDTCVSNGSTVANCTAQTTLISKAANGDPGDASSFSPSISEDGRYVAFMSFAKNMPGAPGTSVSHIYLRDTCANQPSGSCIESIVLVSVGLDGITPAAQGANASGKYLSDNGRYIAFRSQSNDIVLNPPSSGTAGVYVRDMCSGVAACTQRPALLVSVDPQGGALPVYPGPGSVPISGDGRYAAFSITAGATKQVVLVGTGF